MSNYKFLKTEILKLNCSIPLKGMYKLSSVRLERRRFVSHAGAGS